MYKVLLVDDEPIVKIALRSILPWEEHGFEICGTASNGKEALQLTNRLSPDIIITDLKLPVMDGIEFIKALNASDFKGSVLVLSNYDDFEYVRNALVLGAVDYMLKVQISPETLLEQLNKAVSRLSSSTKESAVVQPDTSFQINKLLEFFYEDTSLEDFVSTVSSHDFSFLYLPCSICLLSFDYYHSRKPTQISDTLISSTVMDALEGYSSYQCIPLNKYNFIVLFHQTEEALKTGLLMEQFVQKLPNRFSLYQSLEPAIIYYADATDYEEARTKFHSFSNILQLEFYEKLSIVNARIIIPKHYLTFTTYQEFTKLLLTNGSKDLNKSKMDISNFLEHCQEEHIFPEIVQLFFIKVVDFIEFSIKDLPLSTHEYLSELKESVRFCSSKEELYSHLINALKEIFFSSTQVKEESHHYKIEVEKAISYINDNYSKKLTLTSLAEHVNLSSSYLCRIFKEETGISVTNYMNNLRMEKAKEIILQHNCSLKEVAIRVGIEDQLYFSRLFKNHFSVPPSEFR